MKLSLILSGLASFFLFFLSFFSQQRAVFSSNPHVVISEIQIAGQTATDEFVELYNPTSSDIALNGWKLVKKTQSGNPSNLALNIQGVIPAFGFFLIAHPDYQGTVLPDFLYSAPSNSIAANNTVLLYDQKGNLVDKVGMGNASDFEEQATLIPSAGESIERTKKQDTDNNFNDFKLQTSPNPQNTSSEKEIPLFPSPTPTSFPTIPEEPPLLPTETPTPTLVPLPIATSTPAPTPTEEMLPPTPTPSEIPTPSPTSFFPTPTTPVFPTLTPFPENEKRLIFSGFSQKCYLEKIILTLFTYRFPFYRLFCTKE